MTENHRTTDLHKAPYPTSLPVPPALRTGLPLGLSLVGLSRRGVQLLLDLERAQTRWQLVLATDPGGKRWPYQCDAFGLGFDSAIEEGRQAEALAICQALGPVLASKAELLRTLVGPDVQGPDAPAGELLAWCERWASDPSQAGPVPLAGESPPAARIHLLLASGDAEGAVAHYLAADELRQDHTALGAHTRAMMAGLRGEDGDAMSGYLSQNGHEQVAARYWALRGDHHRAREHWDSVASNSAGDVARRARVEAARLEIDAGQRQEALELIDTLSAEADAAPYLHFELARLHLAREDYGPAEAALRRAVEVASDHVEAWRELATLSLWKVSLVDVKACLKSLKRLGAVDARYHRILGATALLAGHLDRAESALRRAQEEDPTHVEIRLWRAEAAFHRGDGAQALALAQEAVTYHSTLAGSLMRGWIRTATELETADSAGVAASFEATLYGLMEVGLDQLRRPEEVAAASGSKDAMGALLQDLFRDLGGNRSETLTTIDPSGELQALKEPAFGRSEAALILKRAGRIPVSELLDALDSNIQRYRAYPQPWCYKGELLLWLGRFDEAVACFEKGLSIERTRWAYIGIGAVHLLSGRPKDAMNSFAECERECGRLRGATLTVYRGECHRRYGEAKDAIKDLEEAVAAKPTRLGAWINLALSYRADGRHTEAEQAFSQVRQAAPYLMRDAAKSCGLDPWRGGSQEPSAFVPVFEEALRLMGGNRASSVTTYFDPEGRFRAVEPSGPWVSYANDHLFLVREAIQTG